MPFRVHLAAMRLSAPDYRPRDAGHAVLYRVIDAHLEAFLETTRRHADGRPLPGFVEQEFRDFLTCGVLAHGFARLRCTQCAFERLLLQGPGLLPELRRPAHDGVRRPLVPSMRCIEGRRERRGGGGVGRSDVPRRGCSVKRAFVLSMLPTSSRPKFGRLGGW